MAYLALGPVSVGVYAKLNVSGLTALVSSRIYDDVPRNPTFPLVWYEVQEAQDLRGFGTGGLPEIELRVHVFSAYEGAKEAQSIGQKVIELLRDQALTVSGYTQAGLVFYDRTVLLADQAIEGVKVRELVAMFRIYVEE
jgi:hypothetical protein